MEITGGMNGLVLTAGGARGAYQAGVLKRIGEIPRFKDQPSPFSIVAGASAGAINGVAIASHSNCFDEGSRRLANLWSEIRFQDVFKTDTLSLGLGSMRWIKDLSFGGMFGGGGTQSLLDFTPLKGHLAKHFTLDGIADCIQKKSLYAVAISATSYYSGKSFSFIQGQPGHPLWEKSRRASLSVTLSVDHVWASCSIPVIFQPVLLETSVGDYYFGDGGLRLVNPCSPAIRLGANKIFAIGIRSQKSAEVRSKIELLEQDEKKPKMKRPPLVQVLGVALNSIFLDHLDTDLDHLNRMNELLLSHGVGPSSVSKTKEPMKIVSALAINPSIDLASLAQEHGHKMPKFVRYLMEGLGNSKAQSADLMSYLLFDSSYTRALIDLGYQDATQNLAEIEEFLNT